MHALRNAGRVGYMERTNDHQPRPLGDDITHYWLALSMAKAAGADVISAFAEGRLNQEDWAALVHRCQGCQWTEGCTCWLAQADWGAANIPPRCKNRDVLNKLKA